MSRILHVVVVNGSPNERSRTMGLADLVTSRLDALLPVELHRVDVYRLGRSFTGATARADVSPEVDNQIRLVEEADVVVAATPVFRASYSGMFKHFFDFVDQYGLVNKPVILVATGGSDRHALVIEHALRPLFGFFQAATAPVGFYAKSGDFDGTVVLDSEVYSRVEVGLNDIVPQLKALSDGEAITKARASTRLT
ncbi:NAD(P)H-dependent oxidoreductase [Streptomyces marincola]|uniref:FMN reductase n=1 Tax=Streptomyces marincola TaxID=2878388 RepID=A0A1W7CUM9_9ACTN|nr:NAD(P)H-dependent oxidoreductase [Streptomyces marincola]ARQ68455.1 FMN reductase [Streptomyces marincola]